MFLVIDKPGNIPFMFLNHRAKKLAKMCNFQLMV